MLSNPKIPTIQSTAPAKVAKPETSDETTPSKPDDTTENLPTKPASSSEDTSSKANEPEAGESKTDQVMADAPSLQDEEPEPNSEAPAPPLPSGESKKRQREDEEGAATEGMKAKVQKIEGNGAS